MVKRIILKTSFLFFVFGFALSFQCAAQEICNNGIDDDGDLLIDLNDTADCFCSTEASYGHVSSLIPNPSFEMMDSCSDNYDQVDRCKGWKQATDGTSDFYNMTCPWHGYVNHQTVPDGNGFVACAFLPGAMEYVGSCLNKPLLKGTDYELQFNVAGYITNSGTNAPMTHIKFVPVDITLFGTTSCPNFPLTNITPQNPTNYFMDCPVAKGWKAIGKVNYAYDSTWSQLTMTISPTEDIYAVMLGPPCALDLSRTDNSNEEGMPYVLFDNLIINKESMFKAAKAIQTSGTLCNNNLKITGHSDYIGASYQWYKNGIALGGEKDTVLNISANNYDAGKYTFEIIIDTIAHNCILSSIVIDPRVYSKITKVSVDKNSFCPQHTAIFSSASSSVNSCKWTFGDGGISASCNPSHAYKTPGSYDVSLTVTTDMGCATDTTIAGMITGFDVPVIKYAIDNHGGCIPLTANYSNNSTLTASCTWVFGDGSTSANNCSPSHTFNTSGTYTGKLTVTSPDGCTTDSTLQNIIVYNPPKADFSFSPNKYFLPANGPVLFNNQSTNASSYLWMFGDSNSSTEKNTSNSYSAVGEYPITLIASSDKGCTDTLEKTIMVKERGSIEFPTAFIPNKEGPNGGKYDIANIKNDIFFPKYKSIKEYRLMIFNRWGELIFESADVNMGWDGYYRGALCQADVYVWKAELKFEDKENDLYEKSGSVTLLR